MRRFTSTDKWREVWFRRLTHQQKLLWFYIQDVCDPAGVFEFCPEMFSADIGVKITEKDFEALSEKVKRINSYRYVIVTFIQDQYKTLTRECRPHGVVFAALERAELSVEMIESMKRKNPSDTLSDRVSDTLSDTLQYKDKDSTSTGKGSDARASKSRPSSRQEFDSFFRELGELTPNDAEWAWNKWEGNGWINAGKAIRDWRATLRAWKAGRYMPSQKDPDIERGLWVGEMATLSQPAEEEDLAERLRLNRERRIAQEVEAQGRAPEIVDDGTGESF